MTIATDFAPDLPGADLVAAGIDDLLAGRESINALLVAQASTRLRAAGIDVPIHAIADPAERMYRLLEARDAPGAYSTYNALRARLVSFCAAAERDAARR